MSFLFEIPRRGRFSLNNKLLLEFNGHILYFFSLGVDIVVQNFTGNQIADDILLQWSVDNNHTYCVGFYHLLIWSEDDESPTSRYIGQNGYLLEHVAQCMNYRFQLTVYYSSGNGSVAEFNYTVPEKSEYRFSPST